MINPYQDNKRLNYFIIIFLIVIEYFNQYPSLNQFVIRGFIPLSFSIILLLLFRWNIQSIPNELYIYILFLVWGSFGIVNVKYDTETFYRYVQVIIGNILCIFTLFFIFQQIRSSKFIHIGIITTSTVVLLDSLFLNKTFDEGQLAGIFVNPNTTGFIISTGIFSIYLLRGFSLSRWQKYFLIGIELFLIYGIILVASRKMFLAIAFFYVLHFVSIYARRRFLLAGYIIAVLFTFFLAFDIGSLIKSESSEYVLISRFDEDAFDQGVDTRSSLISDGFKMVETFPYLGAGLGNYKYYTERGGYAHNDLMELAATTGLVGMGIYLLIYVIFIYKIRKLRDKYSQRLIYIILIIFFMIGMGQPHFIDINSMIFIFSVFFYGKQKLFEESNY